MLGQVAQLVEQRADNVDLKGDTLRRRLTCDRQVKRAKARGRSQNPCAKIDRLYKGQVAQLVEQRTDNVDPEGDTLRRRLTCVQQVKRAQARGRSQNPCTKINQSYKGQVAQLVEQRTENPCVGGSIPPLATRFGVARSAAQNWPKVLIGPLTRFRVARSAAQNWPKVLIGPLATHFIRSPVLPCRYPQ